jgi:outer membrane protein assembly factor BamB
MFKILLNLLLLFSYTVAQEQGEHVFDTVTVFESALDAGKVLNIANIDKENVLLTLLRSVQLLQHANLTMIEDPMNKIWSWSLPSDSEANAALVAGPQLHTSKKEFFVSDNHHRVYSVSVATGKTKWTAQMDPKILGNGKMHISPHPNGRVVVVSSGEQVMGLSVDLGTVLFHRRVGPAFVSTGFVFVTPPTGEAASSFSPKCLFGDSTGTVHALDTSSGRKAWSWKFSSAGETVDLFLHESASGGVGEVVAVNLVGDLASLRGDTGTLLWRSQILGSDDQTRMQSNGQFLDAVTILLLSNDPSRGAQIHAVDANTGGASVWTLLSGPGSTVDGLMVDITIPYVFVNSNSKVRVFDPTSPTTSVSEFFVNGFPSTPMTFFAGTSEPCTYYVGTTGGSLSLISYESLTDGAACSFSDGEGEPDRKGDEAGVAGEDNDEVDEKGEKKNKEEPVVVEIDVSAMGEAEGMPQEDDTGNARDLKDVADPNIDEDKDGDFGSSSSLNEDSEEPEVQGDDGLVPCEDVDLSDETSSSKEL